MKLIKATYYSLKGLHYALHHEYAFKLEVALSVLIIPLAFFIGQNTIQQAILIMSWLLIPIVELLNSAVETVIDRISKEIHELSGRAKDLGSAAVFVACINATIVWALIILGNYQLL